LSIEGQTVAVYGRHFLVVADGSTLECISRGKKGGIACGDRVSLTPTEPGKGVIEQVLPRRNLLYRADEFRTKLIAANVDQALVVVAAVPGFREELLTRCLVACEAAGIPAVIVLNKTDLPETAALADYLRHYTALGYGLIGVSARGDTLNLEASLRDRISVLVGASGVGKSTLLNRLIPDANAITGDISTALDAGKHTTTHTRLYRLPQGGDLLDSPGMQEFSLGHLDEASIKAGFPEIHARAGQCRFYNCRHLKEPGCAITEAVEAHEIIASRYRFYRDLIYSLA